MISYVTSQIEVTNVEVHRTMVDVTVTMLLMLSSPGDGHLAGGEYEIVFNHDGVMRHSGWQLGDELVQSKFGSLAHDAATDFAANLARLLIGAGATEQGS